jgi:ribose/xylose/arabinose/galactoside ABC-type transport system permease subunit
MKLSKTNVKKFYNKAWHKDYLLVLIIVVLVIISSVVNPKFISVTNLFSILRFASILGFLALGINIIMILGEVDLSAAAIANFTAFISIIFLVNGITNLPFIWIISVLVSVALSFLNSIFTVYIKAPLFVITCGMSMFLTGITRLALRGGGTMYPRYLTPEFGFLGRYDFANFIPMSVIMLIIAMVLIILIVECSPLGRKMYAVGNNRDVSRHVGIEVKKVQTYAFLIAGLLYGVAGILMSSMLGCFIVGFGNEYELSALISVFLGMSFLSSGIPNIKGTLISVILISILVNGFTMMNLSFYIKDIVQGIILIFAIGALSLTKKKKVG